MLDKNDKIGFAYRKRLFANEIILYPQRMPVNEGKREDETRMQVLSNIEKFNKDEADPTFNDLMESLSIVKTQLELSISELAEKGYIVTNLTSWRNMYTTTHYKITDKGKNALEQYRRQVQHFIDAIKQLYHGDKKEKLYQLVMENKDFLWFAYYERLITKEEIENIAKKLDARLPTIWWDKSMQGWGSRYG